MKKALITGVTGQDGSYLTELLLSKGYEVHGIIRRTSTPSIGRINDVFKDVHNPNSKIFLHYADLCDASSLTNLVNEVNPDEVYNLGAQSHVRVSFDVPEFTGDVTGLSTTRLLEAIRRLNSKIRFYQASSSEMFGAATPPQNEDTIFHPRSPYAVAKVYSYWITINYRESYDMYACNGILFNHESPRRGSTFVTRKITKSLCRIIEGLDSCLYLGNLDAKRDWGYAGEYVEAMYLMLQQDSPNDFVIGTGESHSVRDFIEKSLDYVGIELEWSGAGVDEVGRIKSCREDLEHVKVGDTIIKIDPYYFRPAEVDYLLADITKSKQVLGWEPKIGFEGLVEVMMDYDLKFLGKEPIGKGIQRLKEAGLNYSSNNYEKL
ncbi:GDP-mannose 4,6-dehydratase [Roseivirga pacifica]|uniref:GDP-mannose 4,6-dehydratase n=1 Tax=Roseivirga pacifica TaxID=1267423 RepID=UPI00227A64DE|nr:GDP-mannose 4,6-dehydratase [Roseivirga pacifica]